METFIGKSCIINYTQNYASFQHLDDIENIIMEVEVGDLTEFLLEYSQKI